MPWLMFFLPRRGECLMEKETNGEKTIEKKSIEKKSIKKTKG